MESPIVNCLNATNFGVAGVVACGAIGCAPQERVRLVSLTHQVVYATQAEKNAPRSAPTSLFANAISASMRTVSRPSHGIGIR